ncbi:hypothetical protein AJ80_08162 [Polytolypa hystricis UAMH7299]|uniref:Uncharacterized protein n=1 Tax=Polytolypa hystricis (strain UAMH7299) TaxID=1447883 RepID=A0A2B7XCT8_POLH7|nr:hypothetical protein AJ80_08162 [Polytolypa hystricis UAMH7299]
MNNKDSSNYIPFGQAGEPAKQTMASRFMRSKRHIVRRLLTFILLLVCAVLYFLIRDPSPSPKPLLPPSSENVQRAIIMGKTRLDDVSWVYKFTPKWMPFIYTVDNEQGYALHVPKNHGRESMVYLTFIIDHYHTLPDTMLFLHSNRIHWHNDISKDFLSADVISNVNTDLIETKGYMNLRCETKPGCPFSLHPFSPSAADVRFNDVRSFFPEVYSHLFNVTRDEVPKELGAVCCAQFGVSRDRVRQRPLDDYIRMREWILNTRVGSHAIGWVFEEVWHVIFGEDPVL